MTAAVDRLSDLIRDADPAKLRKFMARVPAESRASTLLERAARQSVQRADEDDWRAWLPWLFPSYFYAPFADHHAEFWDWVWSIELGVKPDDAFIGLWARGGAKSTSAEIAVVALGARRRRRYGIYVCETQPQADDHVGNIGTMLESPQIADAYPDLGARAVGKFGSSRGWRRNRLHTADGFVVDALGLDVAARGLKIDEDRPDFIIFDDIDDNTDGPGQVAKKVIAITTKLLPAGSADVAVLGIQNLVHQNGVFGHLARVADRDDIDDFLTNRIVSGPIPALRDATFDQDEENGGWEITAGTPTWEGQNVETCQAQVDEWGITAFKAEAQHDTDAKGGGMFDHVVFRHIERDDCPQFQRAEVWCDPAVTNTDKSDSMAVQCDALGVDKVIYRLRSWERRSTPEQAIKLAVVWAMLEGAGTVGIETDQGGDTWRSVMKVAAAEVLTDLQTITDGGGIKSPIPEYVAALAELSGRDWKKIRPPRFAQAKAGSTAQPKEHRIQQMLTGGYEQRGGIIHVIGTHLILERALFRFPARKPYDLCLAPETLIATPTGDVRIDRLVPGDLVDTRDGPRRVLAAGQSNPAADRLRVEFDDGQILDGTAEHPVWSVSDSRWKNLADLRYGDMVLACTSGSDPTSSAPTASSTDASTSEERSTTSLSSRESYTSSTPAGATTPPSGREQPAATPSTGCSGPPPTDRSPRATTSTTSTGTPATTTSTTSSASPEPNTERSTDPRWSPNDSALTSQRSEERPPSGTAAPRAEHGIARTALALGKAARRATSSVESAARRSRPASPESPSCVLPPAGTPSPPVTPRTTSTGPAPSAAPSSPPGSGTARRTAVVRVRRAPRPLDVGPVWNLTVEATPEFFANGILVHNCDAAYWSWAHLSIYGRPVTTSSGAGKKQPFAKLPVSRPGVSPTPRVGFGRVVPRPPPPGATGRR